MLCLNDRIENIFKENRKLKEENNELKEKIVILTLKNEELSSKVKVLEELPEKISNLEGNMSGSEDIDTLYETIASMNEEIETLKGGETNG